MDIEGSYKFSADHSITWAALTDIGLISKCMPYCRSAEIISPTKIKVHQVIKYGILSSSVYSLIELTDMVNNQSLVVRIVVASKLAGTIDGISHVRLTGKAKTTTVNYSTVITMPARLSASLGTKLVERAAKRFTGQFFDNISKSIATTQRLEKF